MDGAGFEERGLAVRSSRVPLPGGHTGSTLRAGSVCPQAIVITRSCTDVHSLHLPWPARKQLPARATRRSQTGSYDKDVEAWLATYAADAEQHVLHGERLARGHDELRRRILLRLAEPDLHARLLSRVVMGHVVVDLEEVTRNFPEGKGSMEMLCIYEIADGRIAKASFAMGVPVLRT